MINKLFKEGVAGQDWKLGVIQLMILIKATFFIPEYIEYADITSIYKLKGSRQD